jgi:hypothetical protein
MVPPHHTAAIEMLAHRKRLRVPTAARRRADALQRRGCGDEPNGANLAVAFRDDRAAAVDERLCKRRRDVTDDFIRRAHQRDSCVKPAQTINSIPSFDVPARWHPHGAPGPVFYFPIGLPVITPDVAIVVLPAGNWPVIKPEGNKTANAIRSSHRKVQRLRTKSSSFWKANCKISAAR